MSGKTIGYWVVICLLSAAGAVFGARALDQQFGLRDRLGLRAEHAAPAPAVPARTIQR